MFSVGIVGLPNAGKSTLFNALLGKQQAEAAPYPFCTLEPNVGIVAIPDSRLETIARLVKPERVVPAAVKFVDVAGLVKGAHQGVGLGNQFLAHLKECDALCFLLRDFEGPVQKSGSVNPLVDFEVLKTELILKDLETIARAKEKAKGKEEKKRRFLDQLEAWLEKGEWLAQRQFSPQEEDWVNSLFLLSRKPYLVVININEGDDWRKKEKEYALMKPILVAAKLEEELGELEEKEQKEYLKSLGYSSSALRRLVKRAFSLLGLIRFYTIKGGREVRAWAIKRGGSALEAAGLVHSDFARNFVRAEVVDYSLFKKWGSWSAVAAQGKVRIEGRDYQIKDGDIIEFRVNQ